MQTIKRLVIYIIVFAVLAGSFGVYMILRYRNQQRERRQNAKAEEVSITVIEGWTVNDIAKYLDSNDQRSSLSHILPAKDFLAAERSFDTKSYPLLASKPKNADLEGFLFPDTYRFLKSKMQQGDSDPQTVSQEIIKKMLDNFSAKFTVQMQQQAQKMGKSIYEIMTMASIIEKETNNNSEERKIVAGIFYNRLDSGMPLQSDATVNYITKKNSPAASAADLGIDSPYNTYMYKGLPPGPIGNPSLSAIMAALYPTQTDYYYFLHKQPSGEPVYSKTYEEHLQNKAKYLK